MDDWNPDPVFLDYVRKQLEKEGKVGMDAPFFGVPDGTSKTFSLNDVVEEMRTGTQTGRVLYTRLYELNREDFEKYKANKTG